MPSSAAGLILAFDFGTRHLGVAVGQAVTRSATPLTTLDARNPEALRLRLEALLDEWRPAALIVGLPLNMDDSEGPLCALARSFAAELSAWSALPVHLVDERLTSREASGRLSQSQDSSRQRKSRGAVGSTGHAEAARLIAESYLNEGATDSV